MSRFASAALFLIPGLVQMTANAAERPESAAPIVAPAKVTRVDIPEPLLKAGKQFDLDLSSVPAFRDQRNWMELSYFGNRRGMVLPHKACVIVEFGCKRFWLADCFPHPDPTTVVGPFTGNAITMLDLPAVMRDGLEKRNYGTHIHAISAMMRCDDPALAKLGLDALPHAMKARPSDVQSFLHYTEKLLPGRRDAYATMGLAKEADAAAIAMDLARKRIAAVTVQSAKRAYHPGYDPENEQRHGIGVLPDEAWGEAKDGLQAALTVPETLMLNEQFPVHFVVRNASAAPIRFSIRGHTGNLRVRFGDSRHSGGTEGIGGHRQALTHWVLDPGHQTAVLAAKLQIMAEDELRPKGALGNGTPGPVTVWASTSSRDKWSHAPDRDPELVAVPDDEWKGYVKTAERTFTLVADKIPFKPSPPLDLPENHDLAFVRGFPEGLDYHRSEVVTLDPAINLYLNNTDDAHWIIDHNTYHATLAWGPIPADRLEELGLLNRIDVDSRELVATTGDHWDGYRRVNALVGGAKPLAALGLQLVPELKIPDLHGVPPDGLIRLIRSRRSALVAMGLEKETQSALDLLTKVYPPMSPDDAFTVVSTTKLPAGLPDNAWGPENEGLCAAALMPDTITDGATETVRIFIRNTSERDIHLTVSDHSGYDYATATDLKGISLPSERPIVHPNGFSGFIAPVYDPGIARQNPPLATLTRILLKPGAVHELETLTGLAYATDEEAGRSMTMGRWPEGTPAVTTITGPPTNALVTWHLHTANGAEYSKDLKRRTWPARGGWSGILTTAPGKVSLQSRPAVSEDR
jgi:hypothetical protein